ncbi:SNUT3/LISCH7 family protein [Chitinophaga niabensis]|uniref:Uncharacterized protein n=1 Tax=Chitinophaga niabensis TaxID=536979 RepID=A0A1N6H272_9BACT|nr:SNUT3/LISCH7 family protein [Chitinophaga niabensis]SIO13856.1 hypothetical protein SAMN04488055_3129 [Chitinophaga niabensis]
MRIIHSLPAVLVSLMLTTGVQAQDETGLPGDNFSLEGALEMFKKAQNPGEFEKMLNTKENGVNNLDLNQDGDIDYIRVVNKKDGDIQLFVLQALVSPSESQDVAVIELEKTADDHAVIQIVGDEDIYGVSKLVEPSDDDQVTAFDETLSDRPHGPNAAFAPSGLVVNVWFWPSVRFVFAPHYAIWVSPWRWYHYPTWWRPWRPLAWDIYEPICYRYRPRYVIVHTHRIVRAPYIYRPMRVYSRSVYDRNRVVVTNYRNNYRSAPSRANGMDRNVPSRQFDRNGVNRSAPSRQFDRSPAVADRSTPSRQFDRSPDINRSTPSRQFDRNPDIDRSTPSRQFDRSPDINRSTPSRQFDRSPDVNRSTPSREFDRSTPITRPERRVDRSPENVTSPRREYNRNAAPQRQYNPGPQRSFDRSPRSVDRPQRSFDRSSHSISRPQGGQSAPQRGGEHGRSARQRS